MLKILAALLSGGALLVVSQAVYAQGNPVQGGKIFRRCQACHSLVEGQHRVGPSLHGVFGRKAGAAEGFTRYSEVMEKADIVWDDTTLDAYLANPRDFLPGNTMAFPGLRKAEDRADVIAFMRQTAEQDAAQ